MMLIQNCSCAMVSLAKYVKYRRPRNCLWDSSHRLRIMVLLSYEQTMHKFIHDQWVSIETDIIFNVGAIGVDLQFQWQKNRTDLCDGVRYFDTNTDTLRIIQVKNDDKGHYRCLVKNNAGRGFSYYQ